MIGVMESIATGIMRGVLNSALTGTTEVQLVDAIQKNQSLWGDANESVRENASKIPPFVVAEGEHVVGAINEKYGGFTTLVLGWLKKDQPTYYSIIINTEGGTAWLGRQVDEILVGIGFIKKA